MNQTLRRLPKHNTTQHNTKLPLILIGTPIRTKLRGKEGLKEWPHNHISHRYIPLSPAVSLTSFPAAHCHLYLQQKENGAWSSTFLGPSLISPSPSPSPNPTTAFFFPHIFFESHTIYYITLNFVFTSSHNYLIWRIIYFEIQELVSVNLLGRFNFCLTNCS